MGSIMIGSKIEYSFKHEGEKSELVAATVLDRVAMLETRKGNYHVVTGYLIKDENNKVDTIPYWRVKSILN